ncbi:AAA family ATPase [Leucobacter massiliensis]|uniref:HTH luxR-type domain-containing protein n=1 Tax=Leucobacter massiliensis TaxID=1686285 RepID=A0A2S9QNW9_9MICO|nr:AAA family ATPase [Leucobacter massiliensis]PRI11282.1 hypothetical protein B4915_10590 [Leucobacter massiliensis]
MRLLDRPRLSEQLSESRDRSRLLLLRAPAGYGKTTAARNWIEQDASRSLWIDCSAARADSLWRYVAQRLSLTLDAQATTPEFPLAAVREILARVPAPLTLVLDDYHHAVSPENDQLIAELASSNPLVTLVVLARRVRVLDGPLVTSRTPVRIFDAEELAFTPEEAAAFAALYHRADDVRLHAAIRDARGWPLAARAALGPATAHEDTAPQRQADPPDPRTELSRFALNHLEIVNDAGRHVLFAASVLDGVSFAQLEDFTGARDAELREVLHELIELGVLLPVSTAGSTEFVCNPAVRPAFARRSERSLTPEQRAALLHGRARELEHAAPVTAFQLFSASGDLAAAERVLARRFITLTEESETLLAFLRGLPERAFSAHPAFASARLLLETGDPATPTSTTVRLIELMRAGVSERVVEARALASAGAEPPPETRLATIAQRLVLARAAGDTAAAARDARELETRIAPAPAPDERAAGRFAAANSVPEFGAALVYYREIAMTALRLGDLERARRNWNRMLGHAEALIERGAVEPLVRDPARTVGDAVSGRRWRLAALGGLAFTDALDGRMARCAELLDECARLGVEAGVTSPASTWVVGEVARAALAIEHEDDEMLRAALERLTPLRDRIEASPFLLMIEAEAVRSLRGVEWAAAQLAPEPGPAAAEAVADADDAAEPAPAAAHGRIGDFGWEAEPWREWKVLYRASLCSALGDLAGAASLLSMIDPDRPATRLERARLSLFALDDLQALLLAQQAGAGLTVRQRADRTLITALAAWGCGRQREAFEALGEAAALLREHALRTPLRGVPYDELHALATAARDAGVCDLTSEVDAVPEPARSRRYERLTEMELRTLRAIARYRSIGTTAEALFVTAATVKKHLNAVYRKLRSRGREEAILQATRMGLLAGDQATVRTVL